MQQSAKYQSTNYSTPFYGMAEFAKRAEKGELQLPESYRPEDREEAEFYLKYCHYVYGTYSLGGTYVTNGGQITGGRPIAELRAYARGNQDINKYKKLLDFRSDTGDRRELDNVSWENTRSFLKFRNVALSRLSALRYAPSVRAVDDLATEARYNQYLNDKIASDPRTKQLVQATGVMPPGANPTAMSMSPQDVEAFNTLGGYTLMQEIMLQDAIQASFDMSGWDDLNDKLNEDIFDLGICSTLAYNLPGDPLVRLRYIDPAGLIVPRSDDNRFRDAPYRAVIERKSLAELRVEANLDEETLLKAAKAYSNYQGNPTYNDNFMATQYTSARRGNFSALRSSKVDEFRVDVLTLYFVALDVEKYIVGRTAAPYSRNIFKRVGSDAELSKKDIKRGKTFETHPVQYVYRCRWVVGTDIVFDYGKDHTIVRAGSPGNKRALIPLLVYALNCPSMVEACIPTIDDIEVAVRKKRLSMAMLPPGPGFGIDLALMAQSIQIGETTYTLKDLIGGYFNNGILVYQSVGEYQAAGQDGANRPPIHPIQSQKLEELQAFLTEIQALFGDLRAIIGINEIADGSVNSERLLNGVAQQLSRAANAALYPCFAAGREIFLELEEVIGRKYQVGVLYGDIDIRYIPGTRSLPKSIKLDKDIFQHEFYFTTRTMPTEEDKQMMIQSVLKLSAERRIKEDAFFMVMNMIKDGDLEKAKFYMSVEAAKADDLQRQMAMENVAAQSQANQESAMAAEKARAEAEGAIGKVKMAIDQNAHTLRLAEIDRQMGWQLRIATAQKQMDHAAEMSLAANTVTTTQ